MKKRVLILLSMSLVQPLIASEQINSDKQPKKTFWTKTKIGIAAASAIVTTAIVAAFGQKMIYGEKKPTKPSSLDKPVESPLKQKPALPKGPLIFVIRQNRPPEYIIDDINEGAPVNIQDSEGKTPLLIAMEDYHLPVIELIPLLADGKIDNKKIINTEDRDKNTPLSIAVDRLRKDIAYNKVEEKRFLIIKTLADNGAYAKPALYKGVETTLKIFQDRLDQPSKDIINQTLQVLKSAENNSSD